MPLDDDSESADAQNLVSVVAYGSAEAGSGLALAAATFISGGSAGQIVWRAEYDPYGTIIQQRAGTSTDQPLRFPGQEVEDGSDLYQNVFRWYRPGWGRYTQADPLGVIENPALYSYAANSPITAVDPLGLWSFTWVWGPGKPKPTMSLGQVCLNNSSTDVACTNYKGLDIHCSCQCIGTSWVPNIVVFVKVQMYIYSLRYTFTDHLGTPLLQTNSAGQIVWRAEYDPYGTIIQQRAGTSTDQPLRLPGQEVEDGSDLYQNVFRWYRPGWGRYTQADPIGMKGGTNLHAYVGGNPVNAVDRLGLKCSKACPDCPTGIWGLYGVELGFTLKLGPFGTGSSISIFDAQCLSSSKHCTFFTICSKMFGVGLFAGVSGYTGLSINAPCASDIEGIEFGVDFDVMKGIGGSAGASIDPGANVDVTVGAGVGAGASGTIVLCDVLTVSCK